MFEDASRRQFDLLLFWALDRLSREGVLETLQYLNRLTAHGVAWRSFTDQFFDSCGPFRNAGKALGRPVKVNGYHRTEIARLRLQGLSNRAIGPRTSAQVPSFLNRDALTHLQCVQEHSIFL